MDLGLWFRLHGLWQRLLLATPSSRHHWKPVLVGSLQRLRRLRLLLSLIAAVNGRSLPRALFFG